MNCLIFSLSSKKKSLKLKNKQPRILLMLKKKRNYLMKNSLSWLSKKMQKLKNAKQLLENLVIDIKKARSFFKKRDKINKFLQMLLNLLYSQLNYRKFKKSWSWCKKILKKRKKFHKNQKKTLINTKRKWRKQKIVLKKTKDNLLKSKLKMMN